MYSFSSISRKIVTIALLLIATTQFTNALDSVEMLRDELDGKQSNTRHLRGQTTRQMGSASNQQQDHASRSTRRSHNKQDYSQRKLYDDYCFEDLYSYCYCFPQDCPFR